MTDNSNITAVVSGFYVVPNQLRCACGADGDRLWLRTGGDGASWIVCDACHQEVARVTADIMSVE